MNWWQDLRGRVSLDEPLKNKTTFKIGGRARFFIEPRDVRDLQSFLICVKEKMPILILGSGSNVLVRDDGLQALVLQLNNQNFKTINCDHNTIKAGAGCSLIGLIQFAKEYNLSGFEFLAGIPGTLGGALAMNAGAWSQAIGGLVEKVTVMEYNGKIKVLPRNKIDFSYRKSSLGEYIILGASFCLTKKNKDEITRQVNEYLNIRRKNQDFSYPNAGCVFKNPERSSAGKLIDLCGLKGTRAGGALISYKHANFILNEKDAKCEDVLKLMDLVKREVKNRFRVDLEPEIKIWN